MSDGYIFWALLIGLTLLSQIPAIFFSVKLLQIGRRFLFASLLGFVGALSLVPIWMIAWIWSVRDDACCDYRIYLWFHALIVVAFLGLATAGLAFFIWAVDPRTQDKKKGPHKRP